MLKHESMPDSPDEIQKETQDHFHNQRGALRRTSPKGPATQSKGHRLSTWAQSWQCHVPGVWPFGLCEPSLLHLPHGVVSSFPESLSARPTGGIQSRGHHILGRQTPVRMGPGQNYAPGIAQAGTHHRGKGAQERLLGEVMDKF